MNAIAKKESAQPQALQTVRDDSALMRIIERISERDDFSVDTIRELLEIEKARDAHEAMKAYVSAMADLKASEPLQVVKDKHVKFTTQKGVTEYDHATIGNVVAVALGALGRHGFSHRWDLTQKDGKITVRCVVTHRFGHSESVELTASPDDSGGKNGIQAIVSTKTYLERHTLLAALGMATMDQPDPDGRGESEPEESPEAEARIAAEKRERSWLDAFDGAGDVQALEKLQRELIEACAGRDMVPTNLKNAYLARKKALSK